MKTLLYTTISLLLPFLFSSCAGVEQKPSPQKTLSHNRECPDGSQWSTLLQRCISEATYDVVLYTEDSSNRSTSVIGIVFSKDQAKAELFSLKSGSIILEKNEQTLTYESTDQTYRLVRSQTAWVCTETPNENIAKSISIYASR